MDQELKSFLTLIVSNGMHVMQFLGLVINFLSSLQRNKKNVNVLGFGGNKDHKMNTK